MAGVHRRPRGRKDGDPPAAGRRREEKRGVEPLDFGDTEAVRRWLDAVGHAVEDALAAGEDATRPPGKRALGRAMAREHVVEAGEQLRCLMEAARMGVQGKAAGRAG
jgi:hypothetical protein